MNFPEKNKSPLTHQGGRRQKEDMDNERQERTEGRCLS